MALVGSMYIPLSCAIVCGVAQLYVEMIVAWEFRGIVTLILVFENALEYELAFCHQPFMVYKCLGIWKEGMSY